MSNVKFLIIYLIPMVLTYFWRFAFVGAAAGASDSDIGGMGFMANLFMLLSYAGMAYVSYRRGKAVNKTYLMAFPIVGAVFDMILVFIPFVPTIMNIVTIVLGMMDAKPSEVSKQESSNA